MRIDRLGCLALFRGFASRRGKALLWFLMVDLSQHDVAVVGHCAPQCRVGTPDEVCFRFASGAKDNGAVLEIVVELVHENLCCSVSLAQS